MWPAPGPAPDSRSAPEVPIGLEQHSDRVRAPPTARRRRASGLRGSSVGASGAAPLRYQWRFNGADISAATNAAFRLSTIIDELLVLSGVRRQPVVPVPLDIVAGQLDKAIVAANAAGRLTESA